MAKIKFTKGELKKQRDVLKQFTHYLPILQLKKQQLQLEIQRVRKNVDLKSGEINNLEDEIEKWAGVLKEPVEGFSSWIVPTKVARKKLNIAGVDIPLLEGVEFAEVEYDLFATPLWADIAIETIRRLVLLLEEKKVLEEQLEILRRELRITTQRVNLFEKVKIPECKENVRLIRIYLGDQQTNAVGRSKIAKSKIENLILEGIAS
ncbi:MAG: V-type ATP synthase subunit D [Candidatus Omnitrophica bacterium]|nr:V-type ATP synthase subunit D [Candidatus Omnitrophota bacterium]